MKIKSRKSQNGFLALFSALIITTIIVLVVTSVGFRSATSRTGSLGYETKGISYYLAYSCLEEALIALREDSEYAGNETKTLSNGKTCFIFPVETTSTGNVIKTSAVFNNKTTNLQTIYGTGTMNIISLKEVSQF